MQQGYRAVRRLPAKGSEYLCAQLRVLKWGQMHRGRTLATARMHMGLDFVYFWCPLTIWMQNSWRTTPGISHTEYKKRSHAASSCAATAGGVGSFHNTGTCKLLKPKDMRTAPSSSSATHPRERPHACRWTQSVQHPLGILQVGRSAGTHLCAHVLYETRSLTTQ